MQIQLFPQAATGESVPCRQKNIRLDEMPLSELVEVA